MKLSFRWSDSLLLFASAGLLFVALRFKTEARQVRLDTENDIRTLRDEYARLERERASLQASLDAVRVQLANAEKRPVKPSLPPSGESNGVAASAPRTRRAPTRAAATTNGEAPKPAPRRKKTDEISNS
jgi:cytochrome c-type biogenesis protein CcmH/NrfG